MLKQEINKIYRASKSRYGSPRITKELNMQGIKVSQVLVAKIMHQEHLRSIVKKKFIQVLKKQILKNIPEELQNKKRGVVVEWK